MTSLTPTPPPVPAPPRVRGSHVPWIVLSGILSAVVVAAVFLVLIIVGLSNAYTVTVVDRAAHAETFHTEVGDTFDIVEQGGRICDSGDDYWNCVNMHVAMYNTVCLDQALTADATQTCTNLSSFIADTKKRYKKCGAGCTTKGNKDGLWGWAYLRLAPTSVEVSNNDQQPEVTHEERCAFDLGAIRLGTCPGRP